MVGLRTLVATSLLIGAAGVAEGAPKLSGSYVVTANTSCQRVELNGSLVLDGVIDQWIGNATFSGSTVTVSLTEQFGEAVAYGTGGLVKRKTVTASMPFSLTGSGEPHTFKYGKRTSLIYFAQVTNGTARYATSIERSSSSSNSPYANCTTTSIYQRK